MEQKIINWKGYEWRVGRKWGITHPQKDNSWDDNDCVSIENNVLKLSVKHNPKEFDGVVKPYGIGRITCTKDFGYGSFIWKAKLPYGSNLWPALWTASYNSWPPEIDMIEAYTYPDKLDYAENLLTMDIKSNIHYGTQQNHKQVKAKGIPRLIWTLFKNKDGINEYKFVWTKDYVKFYFNNILFRTVKTKQAINELSIYPRQYPIMNLEINLDFNDKDLQFNPVFEIYDFQYIPYNTYRL